MRMLQVSTSVSQQQWTPFLQTLEGCNHQDPPVQSAQDSRDLRRLWSRLQAVALLM